MPANHIGNGWPAGSQRRLKKVLSDPNTDGGVIKINLSSLIPGLNLGGSNKNPHLVEKIEEPRYKKEPLKATHSLPQFDIYREPIDLFNTKNCNDYSELNGNRNNAFANNDMSNAGEINTESRVPHSNSVPQFNENLVNAGNRRRTSSTKHANSKSNVSGRSSHSQNNGQNHDQSCSQNQNRSNVQNQNCNGSHTGKHSKCYTEVFIPTQGESGGGKSSCKKTSSSQKTRENSGHSNSSNQSQSQRKASLQEEIKENVKDNGDGRSFTINLKPGNYCVNVQMKSKTQPFQITLSPRTIGEKGWAPPPKEHLPLLYADATPSVPPAPSLSQRVMHKFARSSSASRSSGKSSGLHRGESAPDFTWREFSGAIGIDPTYLNVQDSSGANCNGVNRTDRRSMDRPKRSSEWKNKYRLAERKKSEGNECYRNKEYRDAVRIYSEAIDLCPECAPYYSNRSASHMMLGKYKEALQDAREAVKLDSTFVKGYIRVAKCNIALGDGNAALSIIKVAADFEPNNKSLAEEMRNAQSLVQLQEDAIKAEARADYRMAIFHIDRSIALAVGCRQLKIIKAEYLVLLKRYWEAQEIVNEILQFDNQNADAIYVRGMCLYFQDKHDQAFTHFLHVLRLAPDHKKAREVYRRAKLLKVKKDEGNQAFNQGKLTEALGLYSEALAIDPKNEMTNSKLYFNRATVRSKLGQLEEAVEDCTTAIKCDETYLKAYLRRAKCYHDLEKYEDEVRDYEKLYKLDRSQENKRLLNEAKIDLKRSKRKDYYKILGVGKTATEDEIKKSYKKMALQHHPDRHSNASEKDKQDHEVKFKEIGEAYAVLTDAKKRSMYDRGQDVNDPDGGCGRDGYVDPNQIFQEFFQGGFCGGFPGGFASSGGFHQGQHQGTQFQNGGVPGAFHFQFS